MCQGPVNFRSAEGRMAWQSWAEVDEFCRHSPTLAVRVCLLGLPLYSHPFYPLNTKHTPSPCLLGDILCLLCTHVWTS